MSWRTMRAMLIKDWRLRIVPMVLAGGLVVAGCGSSGSSSTASSPGGGVAKPASGSAPSGSAKHAPGGGAGASGPGALSAEAKATATGDIPDNQNFLTFKDQRAGFSLVYPEGWSVKRSGSDVTFRNNNNLIHVVVARGGPPGVAQVRAQLARLKASTPSLRFTSPHRVTIGGRPVVKATYTTQSAPSSVTGKRVLLIVDRYVYAHHGRVATVDLGTPMGVDNKDAYRMISQSFRWTR